MNNVTATINRMSIRQRKDNRYEGRITVNEKNVFTDIQNLKSNKKQRIIF